MSNPGYDFSAKMEVRLDDFFGDEIDVEFGFDRWPNRIWIDVHEQGLVSKKINIFREDDGKVYIMVSDYHQFKFSHQCKDDEQPGPKQLHLFPITEGE